MDRPPLPGLPADQVSQLTAELQRTLELLQLSEQRFRIAFGRQFQFMAILSAQGHVIDFNEQLPLGGSAPREQIIGRLFWDTVWWHDQPQMQRAWPLRLQEAAASDAPVLAEDAFTSASGQPRWASAAVHAVRGAQGELNGFIVQASDITDRRQAEEKRAALEAQLREAQKLEAIGTLAGGIAHDFNNILGAILGNLALARAALDAGHPALLPLDQVRLAGRRARTLVQQILAFSRRQPQVLQAQPLQPVLEETLALLRSTLPRHVQVDTRLAPGTVWVRCDATQMQRVLMNLCTNAWHALHDGRGRIEVGLDQDGGGRVHLWVADDGVGMDSATRERIFEPFFTTKGVNQGTGLGLAVVHGIVVEHGGSIDVDSTPGGGSVFHVRLPATDADADAAAAAALTRPPRDSVVGGLDEGGGRHVLVIDDDEVMALLTERLLQRAGWRVTAFLDPGVALEAVWADPSAFDVVVTDFNMPGRNGLEVARELALVNPLLPVIISSGYIPDALRSEAQRLGVRHLLHKENTQEDLCHVLQRAMAPPGTA